MARVPCEHTKVDERHRGWTEQARRQLEKLLSPCLRDPSFCYCGLEKPHDQLGGFSQSLERWKRRKGKERYVQKP